MSLAVSIALATAWIIRSFAPAAGASASCPCLTEFSEAWRQSWINTTGNCQIFRTALYTGNAGDPDRCYPADYGLGECKTWDSGLDPFCSDTVPLSWCSDPWCYVDTSACTLTEHPTPSPRMVQEPNATPHYSYATCGIESEFAKYRRAAFKTATEIVATMQDYVTDLREFIERQLKVLESDESANAVCQGYLDSCDCPAEKCTARDGWGDYEVDFGKLAVTHTGRRDSRTADERRAHCLSLLAQSEFKKIARLEYNDPTRLAFIEYGDQASGVYFSWPATLWCPENYDPRFRPWYVSAVSGHKDVVIVLDKSLSMKQESRWKKAVEGAKRVLETLTEYDFASIVLFSLSAVSYDGLDSLERVTAERLKLMSSWLDKQVPRGDTDFRAGFEKAFSLLEESKRKGKTSGCNKVVLFLTDGRDTSGLQASDVVALNKDNAAVFTFSFGKNAAKTLPKSIACENSGIWYHVADGEDIASAMSGYYMYYANGLAFHKEIRWTEYAEFETGKHVLSGCLPAYNRDGSSPRLLGVVCMDAAVILDLNQLWKKPDYASAKQIMETETSRCTLVRPTTAELEDLRAAASREANCSAPVDGAFHVRVSLLRVVVTISAALVASM